MEDQSLAALRRIPGVAAAYIVDGRGVVGATRRDDVTDTQGALLAALVGVLRQAAADLGAGPIRETIVEAERGAVIAGALGGDRAAVVLADGRANLGIIRVELRRLRRQA